MAFKNGGCQRPGATYSTRAARGLQNAHRRDWLLTRESSKAWGRVSGRAKIGWCGAGGSPARPDASHESIHDTATDSRKAHRFTSYATDQRTTHRSLKTPTESRTTRCFANQTPNKKRLPIQDRKPFHHLSESAKNHCSTARFQRVFHCWRFALIRSQSSTVAVFMYPWNLSRYGFVSPDAVTLVLDGK